MTDDASLPDPPTAGRLRRIGMLDDEICVVETSEICWRVHRTEGAFVLAWNEFRRYGPVLRFDPHPEPPREHAGCGVWYGASTPDAALAEAFQGDRTIDRVRQRPYLTGLRFTRPLRLLDLAVDSGGAWATPCRRNITRPSRTPSPSAGHAQSVRSPNSTECATTAGSPATEQ